MNKEDKEFLKNLQNELLTQSNDGTADPLFWGVIEEHTHIVPDGYGDSYKIFGASEGENFSLEEFVDYVSNIINTDYEGEELEKEWENIDKTYPYEVVDFFNDNLEGDAELLEIATYDELSHTANCFITKKACQEYINKYGYNHNKPRTWAMCAYRNYEYGRLISILKNLNFDDIKED